MLIEVADEFNPAEIESSATVRRETLRRLKRGSAPAGDVAGQAHFVCAGSERFTLDEVDVVGWPDVDTLVYRLDPAQNRCGTRSCWA